jgi:hypothetical protein
MYYTSIILLNIYVKLDLKASEIEITFLIRRKDVCRVKRHGGNEKADRWTEM